LTLPARDLSAGPPEAVIFDIGRVIVRLNPKPAFTTFVSGVSTWEGLGAMQEPSPEQIWTTIQADPRWCDWQEGRITPREWHEHITQQLCVVVAFEEFCAAWNSVLDPQTILPENLFAQLATRCRLGLLSNTDPIHAAHLEDHFSFVRYFPVRIYSNEVGASKPSPAIYQAALTALRVAPAKALFIDDIAEYAETAQQLGLDAIRFETPQQLASELSRRGLIL
jgi:FMN phosphatase YigB (HAD superfamily)